MGAMATDYEKLGVFYLGREYDLAAGARRPDLVLYDSKDLVTHAVCVGMTGSGKTGLGIGLIEEAAIDGVPVLAIDPKGDLANLLLTFPDLAPADFAPWVDPADAGRHNLTPDAFAAQQAELWKKGLAEWDEDGARIARLRAAADFRLYTPGSRAGVPLALLNALSAPPDEGEDDARTRITTTASSLLALAGLSDVAPHSREQALIAAILSVAPATGADLPWLVGAIQKPPFAKVGVLDLETFYPAKDRQELALRFNSVLATPGFDVWLDGDPLDVGSMLYTPAGKPRVAIVSIAHLGDTERMLVVSLLLSALLEWTRKQGGTSSLRAMLYMDEVFGYFPPVANPPSKAPMLTLLKQARAFGVGIVLATQNPVDLDYKGLSNTGTWFLGKLQTERDKARVLDGLEGVTAGLDRKQLDATLSGLRSRVFLMHNVHESGPVVFETRWTLSYLRGPMGREELKRASGGGATAAKPTSATTNGGGPRTKDQGRTGDQGRTKDQEPRTKDHPLPKPVLPANVPEYFINANAAQWRGVLYGSARIHYTDTKLGIDTTQDLNVVAPFTDGAVPVDWDSAEPADQKPEDLVGTLPNPNSSFEALPPAALDAKRYAAWEKDFGQWVMRAERLTLYSAPSVKLTSQAGESERDFRARLSHAGRESRDAAVEKLRASYAPKLARLQQRVQSAQEGVSREETQASAQRTQTMVSVGATVLGALFGRKTISAATLGRATTAVRGVGRAMKEGQDVGLAQQKLTEAQAEFKTLNDELAEEVAALGATDAASIDVQTIEVKPKRGGVDVRLVALAWTPAE